MKRNVLWSAMDWQSRAVLARHLRVHLRNWHTALLPPVFEPLVMLLAFGLGLGRQIGDLTWAGDSIAYAAFLAPGILAYTAFMTSFFQSLFSAFMRMHYQRSWEGQLTTQVRLEHVIWGEVLWAACLATLYAAVVCLVLVGFGLVGILSLHWHYLPCVLPLLFLAALGFSTVGLLFTAWVPTVDHMGLPFFLVILPIGFTSNTYFPMPELPTLTFLLQFNPLYQLAEGLRWLLLEGRPTWHLPIAALQSLLLLAFLLPLDLRYLRRRVLGDG